MATEIPHFALLLFVIRFTLTRLSAKNEHERKKLYKAENSML